ncbi:Fatty acyl-CoA reductase 1 [Blattella germanica]|nr:Fatty acyl-CoA reductase 1 [Blattella germanica]
MTMITDWYNGKTILVTGGTGFMGKVLLEKLLRTCPGIHQIYILARPKRGNAPAARIDEMAKLPLFESLVKNNPGVMKKLVAVECDITKPSLALSKEQKHKLVSEINIVFHLAASLRLEDGMKPSITNNTLTTKHILDFCSEMMQLKVS